ncbi:hypothetical protein B0H19DRAFT_1262613 [Mycena capillaripes]|nr:hypothetical protein B0H19DRAFT_1262613 [Mycena capillaripes]
MVQISRALAFFALVSTGLAASVNHLRTQAVYNGGIKVKINYHDTSVNIEFSGTNANGGSDAIAATTFAEDKAMVNDASAGVAEPGLVFKTAVGVEAIRPGSVIYIQNSDGYYLSRMGPTELNFAKTSPDFWCQFWADPVDGTDYVTLRADNDLLITLDFDYGQPVLWLNPDKPTGWFQAVSNRAATRDYLIVYDSTRPDFNAWGLTGVNYYAGAIIVSRIYKTSASMLITEA